MTDFTNYVCSYRFDDVEWGMEIKAQSFEEAQRRIRAIGLTGKVDGELVATFPVFPTAGIGVRFSCWLRNQFAR